MKALYWIYSRSQSNWLKLLYKYINANSKLHKNNTDEILKKISVADSRTAQFFHQIIEVLFKAIDSGLKKSIYFWIALKLFVSNTYFFIGYFSLPIADLKYSVISNNSFAKVDLNKETISIFETTSLLEQSWYFLF